MAVVREDVVKIGFDVDMGELNKLNDTLEETKKTLTGGMGDDAFDEMIKESKKASEGVDDIKEGLDGLKPDGLDDAVKGLKDTDKSAGKAHEQLKKIANTGFEKTVSGLKKLVSTLGKVAVKAGKVLAKGLAAGMAGAGALVYKAVTNYADYEQLVGGVETLFGAGGQTIQEYAKSVGKTTEEAFGEYKNLMAAQNTVQYNAKNAYKTAGLSANEYMETVTSFSASLISSLGGDTVKAAKYADMAIIDMSDNANKMGTDMGSIQDAYQGFAKQNYTMLDNLKLGYGGTKTEMERLLKDATAISGVKYDVSSYADIVEAIHVIQENMGIAGTTAKEASETISGSWSSLKAAWSNTLTAMVIGGKDFDQAIENLVDSAKTFGKNVMPAIVKGLKGLGTLVEELAPIIEAELPGLIDTLLPPLIKAATSLVKGVIVALPSIISTLVDQLPEVLGQIWSAVKEAFGDMPGIKKAEVFFGKLQGFFERCVGTLKKIIPAVLGVVAAFKIFNKLKFITGLFGNGGSGKGGGLFKGFQSLAKMKVSTVLKGMLNLSIILGGLGLLAAALMAVSPYMAQLSDLKSVGKVLLVISVVGLLGAAMSELAGKVGNIPVATVAKGLANIAIVMVGFGALAAVLMLVAPYVMQLGDLKTTMKLLIVIGAVGLIGSALAGLAGLVGMIPIPVVLEGLANIALALGGFTAIVAAFGALSQISGFNDFLSSGGEVLTNLCNIIGQMAGSLIGGIGEGLTASLPTIGQNISDFATSISPAFDAFANINSTGLGDFASAFGQLVLVLAGEQLMSLITGGIDYAGLGIKLNSMATGLSGFFTTIMAIPDGGFEKATALFNCLAGLSGLPKEGGIVSWFEGETDYSKIATGVQQLATAAQAFVPLESIPQAAFTNASKLFECLAGVSALPKDGGVVGWFEGETDYSKIATGIGQLTSETMIASLTALSGIPATSYTALTSLFNALGGISALPKEGGITSWFGGDSSTGLTNVASQLPSVATNIASFFSNLNGRTDFSPITNLFDTLSSVKIDSTAADKGFLGLGSSEMQNMGQGLSDFASKASGFFDAIDNFDVAKMKEFFNELETVGSLPDALSTLDTSIGDQLSGMVTTVETKMSEIKSALDTGLSAMVEAVSSNASAMATAGGFMMSGLKIGMMSKLPGLIATAQSMASAITRAFNVQMDINSPSGVMIDSGENIGKGGIIGLRSMIPKAEEAAMDFSMAFTPSGRYSPEGDAGTIYNSGGNTETTTISPVFNLTITGSQDDRALARKVQRYVSEGVTKVFESMERKTPVLREV